MVPLFLAFFIAASSAATLPSTTQCVAVGQTGSCEFYECFEGEKNCGPNGYLMGYGYKYCTRFDVTMNKFTPAGQQWIGCVRKCLTSFLLPWYQQDKGTCDSIKTAAFGSHVKCYLSCGFCKICKNNKLALIQTYSISDFFSALAIKQVYEVISTCGIFDCFTG